MIRRRRLSLNNHKVRAFRRFFRYYMVITVDFFDYFFLSAAARNAL